MLNLNELLAFYNKNKNNYNYIIKILNIYKSQFLGNKIQTYYCYPEQQLYIIIDIDNICHHFHKENDTWIYWYIK